MAQWRVSSEGFRVINRDGSAYSLPPGTVLDERPERYVGELEYLTARRKTGYETAVLRPAEDKSGG